MIIKNECVINKTVPRKHSQLSRRKVLIMQVAIHIIVQVAVLVKQTNQYQWKNIYKTQGRKNTHTNFGCGSILCQGLNLQTQADLELGVLSSQLPKC